MHNVRSLAIGALLAVADGARPRDAFERICSTLDRRDRGFLMEIVYGVLRYQITIDWILDHFLRKRANLSRFTVNNLRIAAYQLFFTRVPEHALVNEAVGIEKQVRDSARRTAPLVNAVLRNLIRRKGEFTPPFAMSDPAASLSVNTSHPPWMIRRWIRRFGLETAASIAEANNRIPQLTLRVNTFKTSRDSLIHLLREHDIGCAPTAVSPVGILVSEGHSYVDLSFAHGLFTVQGEASQLVSYLVAPLPGERVLDACAAPGGKTSHLAEMMRGEGEIVAVEKDPLRAGRLKENLDAQGIVNVTLVTGDLRTLPSLGYFDRILVDAPCSAMGVIRKNPDVKYRHTAKDLRSFQNAQLELMHAASVLLAPHGTLVYSVCSTEPEEGEEVISRFLQSMGDYRIIDVIDERLKGFFSDGFFRTYPHILDMDGFFGAQLCKNV